MIAMRRVGVLMICAAALAHGAGAAGHLRIESTRAGQLAIDHAAGWSQVAALTTGVQTLWDLPAGDYVLRFTAHSAGAALDGAAPPAGGSPVGGSPGDPAPGELSITLWNDLTTRVAIDGEARLRSIGAGHDDARGTLLLLPAALVDRLPGSAADQVAALDTQTRWRPGASLEGMSLAPAAERRELAPALGPAAGQGASSASFSGELDACGALDGGGKIRFDRGRSAGRVALGLGARSPQAFDGTLSARLPQVSPLGIPARAEGWLHYRAAASGDPRAVGERVLPHNDARDIGVAGTLELGPAAPGALAATGTDAQGPAALGGASWGVRCDAGARGSRHDHDLEVYRYDEEHAPREETASLWAKTSATWSLGRRTRGALALGLSSYQNSLADGELLGDVRSYYQSGGNAGADESGLYWQGPTDDPLVDPHVFDYYQWKRTTEVTGGLHLTHAAGRETRYALGISAARQVYRRFDHHSPTEIEYAEGSAIGERALVIGYDPERGEPSDRYSDPGRALSARAALSARWRLGRLACRLSAGVLAFDAADSALVDVADPYGGGDRLGPEDLEETALRIVPEAYLGLRGGEPEGLAWWGLAWQQGHLPPLEAVYGPRAYLAQVSPEGVMGNPALAPEREVGAEIGCGFPLDFGGRRWQLGLAGYAGRISDAISMTAAHLGDAAGLYDGAVPVYENGGTLRRGGLHLEAATGRAEGPFWARLSYDFCRIESDFYESPLLDLRWLHPDRVQGEYDSEGYATPLGGILDEWVARGGASQSGAGHPANADRPHALSLALVRDVRPPLLGAGWTLGAIAILQSGRPFTQVLVHPAAYPPGTQETERGLDDPAWERAVSGFPRNEARSPGSARIDLALQRRWTAAGSALTARIETLNLFGLERVQSVYRATGEADEDGCAEDPGCAYDHLQGIDAESYADRLRAPEHYGIPWTLRAQVSVELFR